MIIAVPVLKQNETYYVSPHFGRASYYAFIEVGEGGHKVLEVVENPHIQHEHGGGRAVVELMTSKAVEAVIAYGIGYRAFTMLADRRIKVYYIPEKLGSSLVTLDDAVKMFLSNELEEAVEFRERHRHQ